MELLDLWLPILLSAVLVFIASSVIHMMIPLHKGDYGKLPDEDAVMDALRASDAPRGQYMFPGVCSMKEMSSPEMIEKYRRGPVGTMIVLPQGPPAIGKNLIQWFILSIAISVVAAYVGTLAMSPLTDGMIVFRVTACVALLGYGFGHFQDSIWKGLQWRVSLKYLIDGAVYALVTGMTFAWLWPAAV